MYSHVIEKHGNIDDIKKIVSELPQFDKNQVLIKVKASSLNPADIKVISGKEGGKFIHSSRLPVRLGFDFSGIIEDTGSEISQFNAGDEVFGFLPYSRKTWQGSFSEYVSVDKRTIAKKSKKITFEEAASSATAASTAIQSLEHIGKIKKGYKIFINGASGGVGSFAVQVAKNHGTETWGTSGKTNIEYLRELGVDNALDYRNYSIEDIKVKFDIVFDIASKLPYGKVRYLLREGGIYITLLPFPGFFLGKILSMFTKMSYSLCVVKPDGSDLEKLSELLKMGAIKSSICETYALSELTNALKRLNKGSVRGKIAITH